MLAETYFIMAVNSKLLSFCCSTAREIIKAPVKQNPLEEQLTVVTEVEPLSLQIACKRRRARTTRTCCMSRHNLKCCHQYLSFPS